MTTKKIESRLPTSREENDRSELSPDRTWWSLIPATWFRDCMAKRSSSSHVREYSIMTLVEPRTPCQTTLLFFGRIVRHNSTGNRYATCRSSPVNDSQCRSQALLILSAKLAGSKRTVALTDIVLINTSSTSLIPSTTIHSASPL